MAREDDQVNVVLTQELKRLRLVAGGVPVKKENGPLVHGQPHSRSLRDDFWDEDVPHDFEESGAVNIPPLCRVLFDTPACKLGIVLLQESSGEGVNEAGPLGTRSVGADERHPSRVAAQAPAHDTERARPNSAQDGVSPCQPASRHRGLVHVVQQVLTHCGQDWRDVPEPVLHLAGVEQVVAVDHRRGGKRKPVRLRGTAQEPVVKERLARNLIREARRVLSLCVAKEVNQHAPDGSFRPRPLDEILPFEIPEEPAHQFVRNRELATGRPEDVLQIEIAALSEVVCGTLEVNTDRPAAQLLIRIWGSRTWGIPTWEIPTLGEPDFRTPRT